MARPTLASLAAELGVSRQTISNVINSPDRVKPATLERVRAAIEAAGYRPSAAARQLRTRRSMNLGMRLMPATDGINGSILDRFLHALTESAQDAGYRLTLFCADSHEDEVLQYGELLNVAGIDAFILTSSSRNDVRTKWLQDNGTPFAVFGRPWETAPGDDAARHPWVDIDGAAGTAEAVTMLTGQGHTHIAFLGWQDGGPVGEDRHGRLGTCHARPGRRPGYFPAPRLGAGHHLRRHLRRPGTHREGGDGDCLCERLAGHRGRGKPPRAPS